MQDLSCKGIFSSILANDDLVKTWAALIDAKAPFCCCQNSNVSDFSREAMGDEEFLLRLIIVPTQVYDKGPRKGEIKDTAISQAETAGVSLCRDTAPNEEIMNVAEKLVAGARSRGSHKAGLYGVLRFKCSVARQFKPDDESFPSYCVYDTALSDNVSHGDLFQRVNGADENRRDRRRKGLFSILRATFVPNADFRDGAFIHLAPKMD